MKQRLLLAFFALSFFITSCGSGNDKDGNWAKRADYSGAGRGGAVSFTINQEVYLGLGYSKADYFTSFYKYTNNNWVKVETVMVQKLDKDGHVELDSKGNPVLIEEGVFPGVARREAVAFSINNKGYVGTGIDEDNHRLNDFYEYDPSKPIKDRWSQIEDLPGGIRQSAVAFAFDMNDDGVNDVAYVGTGYGKLDGDDQNNLKDFFKFEDGAWVTNYVSNYAGSKTNEATTFVIGKKAYLVSGLNNLDRVWEFDATTEIWLEKNRIDKHHRDEKVQRTNALAFVIDGLAYITTGVSQDSREVWEYKPGLGREGDWVERNDLEREVFSRIDAIGISINGKGFIVTGSSGTQGLSDMWEFIPGVRENDRDN